MTTTHDDLQLRKFISTMGDLYEALHLADIPSQHSAEVLRLRLNHEDYLLAVINDAERQLERDPYTPVKGAAWRAADEAVLTTRTHARTLAAMATVWLDAKHNRNH